MADPKNLEKDLRVRVARFLAAESSRSSCRKGLLEVVGRIRKQKWNAVLFGGALRDLMIYGSAYKPRDVDIVVAEITADRIASVFSDCVVKRTRFGGLHLQCNTWSFDIWPLADTWALRNSAKPHAEFEDLPRTTFLNVEAVATDLSTKPGRARQVRENGFFESIAEGMLDINNEENPFPTLCVVRTLITAAQLRFSMSRRLCKYLVHYGKQVSPDELVDVQLKHYGTSKKTAEEFHYWIQFVAAEYQNTGNHGLELPIPAGQQPKRLPK
jgi:hypothetical protein